MGEFPSGQRGQTVNLLAMPSVVRIHLPPPSTGIMWIAWFLYFLFPLRRCSGTALIRLRGTAVFTGVRRCAEARRTKCSLRSFHADQSVLPRRRDQEGAPDVNGMLYGSEDLGCGGRFRLSDRRRRGSVIGCGSEIHKSCKDRSQFVSTLLLTVLAFVL